MTSGHLATQDALEPTAAQRRHLGGCVDCEDLAADVAAVRALARGLPPGSWAGGPDLSMDGGVDVEAALTRALAMADAPRPALRAPRLLRFASSAAAALLLFSLVAPVFLRMRIEGEATAGAAPPPTAAGVVFWTTSTP